MASMMLLFLCVVGMLVVIAIGVGIMVVMGMGKSDAVSDARQGWISRRSDKDEEGW
jgi:hypothetical protein